MLVEAWRPFTSKERKSSIGSQQADEARRLASNFAKLSELLGQDETASVGALFGRSYRLGLLIQCAEEGSSTFQFLCKPHPCLSKIGKMLS